MLNSLLDPIFFPLLKLGYTWALVILSFLITLLITIIYKYVTDQDRMKYLKKELKKLQAQMREKQKSGDLKSLKKLQAKMMPLNGELMKHSMKPTLYTFIPIIIIFGWLSAHLAYHPIMPGEEFSITAVPGEITGNGFFMLNITPQDAMNQNSTIEFLDDRVKSFSTNSSLIVGSDSLKKELSWRLKIISEGDYEGTVYLLDNNKKIVDQHSFPIIISRQDGVYAPPVIKAPKDKAWFKEITISNKEVKPFGNLSLFGWHPGWLGAYIILSIIFSTLLRKALGVV